MLSTGWHLGLVDLALVGFGALFIFKPSSSFGSHGRHHALASPFGSLDRSSWGYINFYGSSFGNQVELRGGQGVGHAGVDLVRTDGSTDIFAPINGTVWGYEESTGTIIIRGITDYKGMTIAGLEMKLVHVAQKDEQNINYFELWQSIKVGDKLTRYGDIGYTGGTPHLHLGLIIYPGANYSGSGVYYDPQPSLP